MTPRLKQLPLFLSPALERVVQALPARERDIACELHRLVIDDDRTWLEVVSDCATTEATPLAAVLSGDRHARPTRARHRAWWMIREGTNHRATYTTIGDAFAAHHTSVLYGVRKYSVEVAAQRAIAEAIEKHQAEQAEAGAA